MGRENPDETVTGRRPRASASSVGEVFRVFLGLGLTSFGGPVAHLGYFHETFVVRRKWLGERAYTDLVALCQFLPGPASSQVGMAIGLHRAGLLGLLAAWSAFTLPSAVALVAFGYGVDALGVAAGAGWIQGLKAGAVAVVAHAVLGMSRTLTPDKERAAIAVLAAVVVLVVPSVVVQVVVIALGAAIGLAWLRPPSPQEREAAGSLAVPVRRRTAVTCIAVFAALLVVLPVLAAVTSSSTLGLVDGFYRAGSLVFGGGHVVLPLLEAETVRTGLVDRESFLAGYGAAQAVPGPLFTFAAYLGTVTQSGPTGALGAAIALLAVFLPSALLVVGALPFWERLRRVPRAQQALAGVGAAVVGLLAAALYDPVFVEGVTSPVAMAVAAAGFVALSAWKVPAWAVVIGASLVGWAAL